MPAKRRIVRAMRIGFLSACALLLVLLTLGGCWDEEKPCKASAECATGEICAGPGAGTCAVGTCTALTSADCPTCDVVTNACLVNHPY